MSETSLNNKKRHLDSRDILNRPIITEKSELQREDRNCVSFEVGLKANKIQIKNAVEKIFGVTVVHVNTQIIHGKVKRVGKSFGRRPNWKKAIVTLKEGESIDFFEGV